jgi:hypothetical protein
MPGISGELPYLGVEIHDGYRFSVIQMGTVDTHAEDQTQCILKDNWRSSHRWDDRQLRSAGRY